MATKTQKNSAKQQMRELQALINEWDPEGLLKMGAPRDEYDCLVGPILSRLMAGVTEVELAHWLASHMADHFGGPPPDAGAFAGKVRTWYDGQKPTGS